ncbi:unnamed protein product [Umbelopsis ramanniana]
MILLAVRRSYDVHANFIFRDLADICFTAVIPVRKLSAGRMDNFWSWYWARSRTSLYQSRRQKVILAVRNLESGDDAKVSIEETTKRSGVVEVWKLDMSSSASVPEFANKVNKELPRLDVAALNASAATKLFKTSSEGWEETLQVNVISTAYLAILLLPKISRSQLKNHCQRSPSENVTSKEGYEAQMSVWKELRDILYKINPDTSSIIDN